MRVIKSLAFSFIILIQLLFCSGNDCKVKYWISEQEEEYLPTYVLKLSCNEKTVLDGELFVIQNKIFMLRKSINDIQIAEDSLCFNTNVGVPVSVSLNRDKSALSGFVTLIGGNKISVKFQEPNMKWISENYPEIIGEKKFAYKYSIPKKCDGSFETADLSKSIVKQDILFKMLDRIGNKNHGLIDAFILVKDNKTLIEEYFNGYTSDAIHFISSNTKTVSALITAIAVDKGIIASEDEKVFKYFDDYRDLENSQNKDLSIDHLLKMQAGFDTENYFFQPGKDFFRLALDRPMKNNPGTVCEYDNAIPNLYAKIIYDETGKHIDQFGKEVLFDPLGIESFDWNLDKYKNFPVCQGTLQILPMGMAKIGSLLLNKGKWNDKQIISEKWIQKLIKRHSVIDEKNKVYYGMTWWIADIEVNKKLIEVIYTGGSGGQFVFVIPELKTIVVFNGSNFDTILHLEVFDLLSDEILPALL